MLNFGNDLKLSEKSIKIYQDLISEVPKNEAANFGQLLLNQISAIAKEDNDSNQNKEINSYYAYSSALLLQLWRELPENHKKHVMKYPTEEYSAKCSWCKEHNCPTQKQENNPLIFCYTYNVGKLNMESYDSTSYIHELDRTSDVANALCSIMINFYRTKRHEDIALYIPFNKFQLLYTYDFSKKSILLSTKYGIIPKEIKK